MAYGVSTGRALEVVERVVVPTDLQPLGKLSIGISTLCPPYAYPWECPGKSGNIFHRLGKFSIGFFHRDTPFWSFHRLSIGLYAYGKRRSIGMENRIIALWKSKHFHRVTIGITETMKNPMENANLSMGWL